MPSSTYQIADLLDYEAQLAQDELEPIQNIIQRDRTIGQQAPTQNDRRALLSYWLEQVRAQNPRLPGRVWIQTSRITLFACVALGVFSGFGTMRVLLRYDGNHPVDIFSILGVFVFLQIFFLTMLGLLSIFRSAFRQPVDAVGFFQKFILKWLRTNLKDVFRHRERTPHASNEFIKRFHALHAPLEGSVAMKFFQTFVLAFHVGALVFFLYTLTFSDIVFSWATTLRFSPPVFHQIILAIATPFVWLGDVFVPDAKLIEFTQYSRIEKAYVHAPSGSRLPTDVNVGSWWPFLAACIFTYGVLPRLCLVAWEHVKIKSYLRRRKFDDHASLALEARLTKPAGIWAAGPGTQRGGPAGDEAQSAPQLNSVANSPCLVLKWFGFPADDTALKAYLQETFRLDVNAILSASGTASDERRIADHLLALAARGRAPTLLIASDPWEVPGEAAERLLKALRTPPLEHLICLFAPLSVEGESLDIAPEKDVAIWRQSLRSYRDRYAGLITDLGGAT